MTAHNHTEVVPGCYRCDLNRDEMGLEGAEAAQEGPSRARTPVPAPTEESGTSPSPTAADSDTPESCPDCATAEADGGLVCERHLDVFVAAAKDRAPVADSARREQEPVCFHCGQPIEEVSEAMTFALDSPERTFWNHVTRAPFIHMAETRDDAFFSPFVAVADGRMTYGDAHRTVLALVDEETRTLREDLQSSERSSEDAWVQAARIERANKTLQQERDAALADAATKGAKLERVEALVRRGVGTDLTPTTMGTVDQAWMYHYIGALDDQWRTTLRAALSSEPAAERTAALIDQQQQIAGRFTHRDPAFSSEPAEPAAESEPTCSCLTWSETGPSGMRLTHIEANISCPVHGRPAAEPAAPQHRMETTNVEFGVTPLGLNLAASYNPDRPKPARTTGRHIHAGLDADGEFDVTIDPVEGCAQPEPAAETSEACGAEVDRPCRCVLPKGHSADEEHVCEHTRPAPVSEADAAFDHGPFCPAFSTPRIGRFPAIAAEGDCTCPPAPVSKVNAAGGEGA